MYVDSGSGSMIISAVVAGAAGAGVVAKVGMRKITGAFKRGDSSTQAGPASQTPDTTERQ